MVLKENLQCSQKNIPKWSLFFKEKIPGGVPQGSVLGLVFFVFFINNLHHDIS